MTLDEWCAVQSDRCSGCGHHLAKQGCRCSGSDWDIFQAAARSCAKNGVVHQNDMRPKLRGRINPKAMGGLYTRAVSSGFMKQIGKEPSRDTHGRNTHHDAGIYRLAS